jgi:hypothetical protein
MCTYTRFLISQSKTFDGNMDRYALFVLTRSTYRDLQVLQCLLAHTITSRFTNFKYANEFGLENDSIAKKSRWFITV